MLFPRQRKRGGTNTSNSTNTTCTPSNGADADADADVVKNAHESHYHLRDENKNTNKKAWHERTGPRSMIVRVPPVVLLLVLAVVQYLQVHVHIKRTSISSKMLPQAQIFEWQCWDKCSCLPPVNQIQDHDHDHDHDHDTAPRITMHQSYKTSDPQTWHFGWKHQRQTWIDLHPTWFFIFWTDEQNELLAKCIGYEDILRGRSGIQKADLSRLMYLYKYGGFYSDLDYIALQNHQPLFDSTSTSISTVTGGTGTGTDDQHHHLELKLKNQLILLQGRQEQVVGLEWGFARRPEHPIWTFCLDIANRQNNSKRTRCPISFTGPHFFKRCLKKYFKLGKHTDLEHMVSYGTNELVILEPKLIAPIGANDFTSECGIWRSISDEGPEAEDIVWTKTWQESPCKQNLIKNGTYAVTIYSHSWGDSLKC